MRTWTARGLRRLCWLSLARDRGRLPHAGSRPAAEDRGGRRPEAGRLLDDLQRPARPGWWARPRRWRCKQGSDLRIPRQPHRAADGQGRGADRGRRRPGGARHRGVRRQAWRSPASGTTTASTSRSRPDCAGNGRRIHRPPTPGAGRQLAALPVRARPDRAGRRPLGDLDLQLACPRRPGWSSPATSRSWLGRGETVAVLLALLSSAPRPSATGRCLSPRGQCTRVLERQRGQDLRLAHGQLAPGARRPRPRAGPGGQRPEDLGVAVLGAGQGPVEAGQAGPRRARRSPRASRRSRSCERASISAATSRASSWRSGSCRRTCGQQAAGVVVGAVGARAVARGSASSSATWMTWLVSSWASRPSASAASASAG